MFVGAEYRSAGDQFGATAMRWCGVVRCHSTASLSKPASETLNPKTPYPVGSFLNDCGLHPCPEDEDETEGAPIELRASSREFKGRDLTPNHKTSGASSMKQPA